VPRNSICRNRMQRANAIRGYAAEFGVIAAKAQASIDPCCSGCTLTRAGLPRCAIWVTSHIQFELQEAW
jgi:hypothetical protein